MTVLPVLYQLAALTLLLTPLTPDYTAEFAGLADRAIEVQAAPYVVPEPWSSLADCESGSWDANSVPMPGTARWDYGAPGGFVHDGFESYDGGLNFAPSTWTWGASELGYDGEFPHAYQAPARVQVEVGRWVRERQTWAAWPVCSRMIGVRR